MANCGEFIFDSDLIFRGDIVYILLDRIKEAYELK